MNEKLALDDIQKAKIELEEKYRSEVRSQLGERSTKKSLSGTVWAFVNSSLGLWLLSAIFISGAGALYTQYRDARAEKLRTRELIERLDLEIGYRFSQIQIQLYSIVDSTHSFLPNKSEEDVRNILIGLSQPSKAAIAPLYQEFSNMSTIAAIAELRRYLPPNERDEIDQVLAHMSGIHIHLDVKGVKLSNVKGVADMIFQDLMLKRWKESRFYFTDCAFC